jgi:hypothetical protein
MPKLCESCEFYSAENTPTECPKCHTGLKFTLLPPRGQAAAPLPNVGPTLESTTTPARALRHNQKEGFLASMGIADIPPKYIWMGFLMLVGVCGFFARQYQTSQRLKAVEPGMHISEAAKLIDADDGDDAYYDDRMVRFRDNFAPNDRSSGAFEYEDGAHHMVIHWYNGVVTRVENKGASSGGLRRSGSITIVDSDDDDDDDDN